MVTNQVITPYISLSNSKLGEFIPSINLPAGVTCREDAPCKKGCYAMKGRFAFPSVKTSMARNLMIYQLMPDIYFGYIKMYLHAAAYKYFRFHSSGDIVDMAYLEGMVDVAKECKRTKFLCFTKKYELVNDYIKANGKLPANLIIVFSNWKDFKCENPYNLPTSYVRFKDCECDIPETATQCTGFCGECVNTKASCWKMKAGQSVVFNKH